MDANRAPCAETGNDCACTTETPEKCLSVQQEYHDKIEEIKVGIKPKGRGLIIDIHGHAHDHQMSEIGYHLSECRITYLAACDPENDPPLGTILICRPHQGEGRNGVGPKVYDTQK